MEFSDFPYEPYDIQIQLMEKIYESLDKGKVAIIESPTGTGKSLSIICSVLKWIDDHKASRVSELSEEIKKLQLSCANDDKNSDDWFRQQSKQIAANREIQSLSGILEKVNKHLSYSKELKKKASKLRKYSEAYVVNSNGGAAANKRSLDDDFLDVLNEEDELIVKYCESDDLVEMMDKETKWEKYYQPKIYYCSRTHSQLSQFINEVKKTKRCTELGSAESLMLVPLSSRVNYCINESVNRFGNVNLINEKCNELQSGKQKCGMYKQVQMQQLNEDILANVQDLEDIVTKAKQLKACPYYASRFSIAEAEIVILPYNILLHKATRDSFGVHLKDSVVIVDEAHNLLETLSNVYSIEIRLCHLEILHELLGKYMTRYYTRLSPQNIVYLKQLLFIVKKLRLSLKQPASSGSNTDSLEPLEFVLKLEIEHINVYKLVEFIDKSHIANKLHMFSLRPPSNEDDDNKKDVKKSKISGTRAFLSKLKGASNTPPPPPPDTNQTDASKPMQSGLAAAVPPAVTREPFNSGMLYTLKELLLALRDCSVDGKVLLSIDATNSADSTCKYVVLNSSSHFQDILKDCRSVILCGGTMKPFEDYINQLFKPLNIPNERVLTFSCDHVIAKENLIAMGCGRGPNNGELSFTFTSRSSPQTIAETGQAVLQYCQVIPKGVVVFFSSYDYEELVLKQWQQMGILKMIEKCKRIFKEPKKSSLTAAVLNGYTRFIKANQSNGAVLFSVIGGKMSEGINFSDDLGRGVIVLGLPYANKNSIELKEKMAYLERYSAGLANEYYENLCMRAVNQSIGRAIRHKNDYAAIILLDSRYCTKQSVKMKLSDWIKSRYTTCDRFTESLSQIRQFFESKKEHELL